MIYHGGFLHDQDISRVDSLTHAPTPSSSKRLLLSNIVFFLPAVVPTGDAYLGDNAEAAVQETRSEALAAPADQRHQQGAR